MDTHIKDLMQRSPSIEANECDYWIALWPHMTEEQKYRFEEILAIEREKLDELNEKYPTIEDETSVMEANKILKIIWLSANTG